MSNSKPLSKGKEAAESILSAGKSKYPENHTMFALKIKNIAIPLKISRYTIRFAAFTGFGWLILVSIDVFFSKQKLLRRSLLLLIKLKEEALQILTTY